MRVVTFDEAWDAIPDNLKNRHIVLGNGFNIALRLKIFTYCRSSKMPISRLHRRCL